MGLFQKNTEARKKRGLVGLVSDKTDISPIFYSKLKCS